MSLDVEKKGPQTVRTALVGNSTLGSGTNKGRQFLNAIFESIPNPLTKEFDHFFIKRPGIETLFSTASSGPGRGVKQWARTNKLYSVNNNKIYSNTTDLGVTLTTDSGICGFAETRPGATTQYLGINDGSALYLIGTDDSVIVMNNISITSSSVANPTVITANAHGLATGNKIIIRGHAGSTPSINDVIFTVTVTGPNTFTIPVNVSVGGTGGTIGFFPTPNTSDLEFMDGYWFTLKVDNSVWNCSVDDPTTWPATSFIFSQMLPGNGVGLGRQNNVLMAFSDRHVQMFFDNANPVGSPLANIEQAMQQIGCVANNSIAAQENTVYWVSNTLNGGFTVYRLDGTSNIKDIGTPQLNRSLVKNLYSLIGGSNPKQVVLQVGETEWIIPADFNPANNTIEAIGGGGGGGRGPQGSPGVGGDGGGGGAYAKIINFNPGGATQVPVHVGDLGIGGSSDASPATAGGDTTFNTTSLIAKGGSGAGAGGSAAASTGTVKRSGGNGGSHVGSGGSNGGGGGGGAAGNIAAGANGANGATPDAGDGGNGGQGNPSSGGQGGIKGDSSSSTEPTDGANGGEWVTAGSGGGGGGAAAITLPLAQGAKGGKFGGGGGGGGAHAGVVGGGLGGNGANGVIVITYTPSVATADTTITAYILRILGHVYYVLNLLTIGETWVYDQDLEIWSQWNSGLESWPVMQATQFAESGQPYSTIGQDLGTGKIWRIASTIFQDDGTNFTVLATSIPLDFGQMKREFFNRVELIGDRQTGTTPVLVSYSDDDYATFSTPRILDMSLPRAFSVNWGNSRRRVYKLEYTGNGPLRLQALEFELEFESI